MVGQSQAQIKQHDHAFYIARLRDMWVNASLLRDTTKRDAVRAIIDAELESLGAISQVDRQKEIQDLHEAWLGGDEAAGRKYKQMTKPLFRSGKVPF